MYDVIRTMLEDVPLTAPPFDGYRPLIVDGLEYFISRLPEARLAEIVAEQFAMAEATTDERIVALLRRCPTLHKLGQVVAHEHGLPLSLRERLQWLESMPPSADLAAVKAVIRAEVGDIEGLVIADEALAQGSVAIVVPFELRAAPGGLAQRGVFKVLLPGIEQRLDEDLTIWPELAGHLEARSAAYDLPPLDYRGFLDGVGRLLRDEIKLDREQTNLGEASRFYANIPDVIVPRLFPFSTPRVTAMERVDGKKVTETDLAPAVRRRLAETIVSALLAKPFWRGGRSFALFHADPHAGNLLVTPDGRLAVLDWALTTTLDKRQLGAVVRSLANAATLDERGLYRSLAELGTVQNEAAVRTGITAAIREIRTGRPPGFTWLVTLLDALARQGAIEFVEVTVLFRKAVLSLSGVVEDVSNGSSIDNVIVSSGAFEFLRELPIRALFPPASRAFGTHLSNLDLFLLWSSWPWVPARYAVETARDAGRWLTRAATTRRALEPQATVYSQAPLGTAPPPTETTVGTSALSASASAST